MRPCATTGFQFVYDFLKSDEVSFLTSYDMTYDMSYDVIADFLNIVVVIPVYDNPILPKVILRSVYSFMSYDFMTSRVLLRRAALLVM